MAEPVSDFKQQVGLITLTLFYSKHWHHLLALSQLNEVVLFSTSQKFFKISQQLSSESQPGQLSVRQFANIRHIRLHPHNFPNLPVGDINRLLVYSPAYLCDCGDLDPGSVFFPLHFSMKCLISEVQ